MSEILSLFEMAYGSEEGESGVEHRSAFAVLLRLRYALAILARELLDAAFAFSTAPEQLHHSA